MITTKYMENKTMSNSKFWRYPPTLLTELYEVYSKNERSLYCSNALNFDLGIQW